MVVICALPLWLLFEPRQQFGSDWSTHVWLTSYYGEFFKQHHGFPEVVHTVELAGMPYPVFYGFLLYPLLGLISSFTDPHAAVRLAVAGVFLLQTWQVFRLVNQTSDSRRFGLLTAALVSWSTYALTNLYNRGALNELIAVALLTAAICAVCRAALLPAGPGRFPPFMTGLFCYVLATGAHPITAVFGGIFFGLVAGSIWIFAPDRNQLTAWFSAGALAGAVVVSPWAYVVLKFGSSLYVSRYYTAELIYWPATIDSLATRLMPFPYDRRMVEDPQLSRLASPYLDTQVTAGLLILSIFLTLLLLLARRRRLPLQRAGTSLVVTCWGLFLVILAMSVSPVLGRMPDLFRNLQFAYRLVSYLNLALLLVIVGGLAALSTAEARKLVARWSPHVLGVTLALAAFGLVLKLQHGRVNQSLAAKVSGSSALRQPDGFYGVNAYAITSSTPDETAAATPLPPLFLQVGTGPEFGRMAPLRVNLPGPELRELRVQPFPWNELRLNGRILAADRAPDSPTGPAVSLPAGENEITYAWQPDRTWVGLILLSRTTLLAWFGYLLFLHGRALRTALR